MKINIVRVDETNTSVVFDEKDVERIFTWFAHECSKNSSVARSVLDGTNRRRHVESKIRINQVEEGSPAYRVDKWRAYVTLTEDHSPYAEAGGTIHA